MKNPRIAAEMALCGLLIPRTSVSWSYSKLELLVYCLWLLGVNGSTADLLRVLANDTPPADDIECCGVHSGAEVGPVPLSMLNRFDNLRGRHLERFLFRLRAFVEHIYWCTAAGCRL